MKVVIENFDRVIIDNEYAGDLATAISNNCNYRGPPGIMNDINDALKDYERRLLERGKRENFDG